MAGTFFQRGKNLLLHRQELKSFKINLLNIIFDDFSIWVLAYRTEFTSSTKAYFHKCWVAMKYRWIWCCCFFLFFIFKHYLCDFDKLMCLNVIEVHHNCVTLHLAWVLEWKRYPEKARVISDTSPKSGRFWFPALPMNLHLNGVQYKTDKCKLSKSEMLS